ncbi:hypothetical protein AMAG_19665 [Allomyces macrogynus ATCC 38327]|uniref:Uncharacterized protein n=1 Tax=Allomyces macrogynus (strain ATCC 38327) TaxID=578462 RepID=A0A0L0SXR4_ALLM3|nr:hypothetical protein AMAG_19665 [Allomyces macrogynus ATCC 38327]|eukprot:KNE67190.1 hypothetical protein AMAG_19665 [Allomyces macrogynus ATCC 38327]
MQGLPRLTVTSLELPLIEHVHLLLALTNLPPTLHTLALVDTNHGQQSIRSDVALWRAQVYPNYTSETLNRFLWSYIDLQIDFMLKMDLEINLPLTNRFTDRSTSQIRFFGRS